MMEEKSFPIEVGIVFLEGLRNNSKTKSTLNFDQYACCYLLLQLNAVQKIFEFNIINTITKDHPLPSEEELRKDYNNDILDWFDSLLVKQAKNNHSHKIRYWMAITSEHLPGNLFATALYKKESKSQMNIGLITTDQWDRSFSPPSLFEYIIIVIFKFALLYLSSEFGDYLDHHDKSITKGCIYDVAWTNKAHRRFTISTPNLCVQCINNIKRLEQTINEKNKEKVSLCEEALQVLNKDWMGSPDKRNTPLFNLKRDYKYDIDRNSGLYKSFFEKFRDSIQDNLPQWIVGTLISGVIGAVFVIAGLR